MFKILIAEDDAALRKLLKKHLTVEGFAVTECADGGAAADAFEREHFDLLISDVMMPDTDGNELVKYIKGIKANFPIIILSALETFSDKKKSFGLGADDYVVKPVDFNELILRVSALLRRCRINNEKRIIHKNVILDYDTGALSVSGENKQLTKKEFLLLFKFMSSPDKIFTRRQLLDEIWGFDSDSIDRTVDVHINKIREFLDDSVEIISVRGIGYKAVLR
jgi:DNA-binding response OmpR family regulator